MPFKLPQILAEPRRAAATLIAAGVLAASLAWADLSVSQRLQLNSTLVLLLQNELKHESSGELRDARLTQAKLIEESIDNMEAPSIKLLSALNPELDPHAKLEPAIKVLRDTGGTPNDIEALEAASSILGKAGQQWSRDTFAEVSVWGYKSNGRVAIAERMLQEFYAVAKDLNAKKNPTVGEIERACLASRFATAMVLSAWVDFEPNQRAGVARDLKHALSVLNRDMLNCADSGTLEAKNAERVRLYARNVDSRYDFIASMDAGGIKKGRETLVALLK